MSGLVDQLRALDSPASRLLGREILAATPEGVVELRFRPGEELCNENGVLQGGMVTAMLDATLGNAVKATLPAGQSPITLEVSARFLRPAPPGPVLAFGRVLHRGRSLATAEAELRDADGRLLAHAVSTKRIG